MLQKGDIVRFIDPEKWKLDRQDKFVWSDDEWRGLFRVRDVFKRGWIQLEMVGPFGITSAFPCDAVAIADPNTPCFIGEWVLGKEEINTARVYPLSECLAVCQKLQDAAPDFEFWPVLVPFTNDLDTQPVTPLAICPNCVSAMEQTTSGDYVCPRCRYQIEGDNGEDTIITRPPVEICPKCGKPMDDLPPADELDDPNWHYFMCVPCDTHRAYWWVDGRKLER